MHQWRLRPRVSADITVLYGSADETVGFAVAELREYLDEMLDADVAAVRDDEYDPDAGLWVGTDDDLPVAVPAVEDAVLDDHVRVSTDGRAGIIAGNNPRSTLLAVYRYLRAQGCRWVRPGPDGEVVPSVDTLEPVEVDEAPSYRHRGVTIEGAVGETHVRDIVDWLPKVGMNAYFFQFFRSAPFFRRWYEHEKNPTWEGSDFSEDRLREVYEECVAAVEKRGLAHHAVGHGWTARALGLPGDGWEDTEAAVEAEYAEYVAKVDGERRLYDGIPTNTELCYSNPAARELLVDTIATYAEAHPEVDVLHVWASDGHNNHCECADCRGTRPSDLYVRMLNELDERLEALGVDTRVAFLIYTDLMWPPETERFDNPDRFSLMYAPITRSYSEGYADVDPDDLPGIPPYERNELAFPRSLAENVAFLEAWQEVWDGDVFDFDYHLMWNHFDDPGEMRVTDVLASDMRHLADLDVDGNVSCQVQRAFFPSGVAMAAMARTLWDRDTPTEDVVDEHFRAAFGREGDAVRDYLRTLSDCFDPLYANDESLVTDVTPEPDENDAESFAAAVETVEQFRPVIDRNCETAEGTRSASWRYLDHHADIVEPFAKALAARARGDDGAALELWRETRDRLCRREPEIHPAVDVYWFVRICDAKFGADPTRD
jgi:hypothetical protein